MRDLACFGLALVLTGAACSVTHGASAPSYDDAFWKHWGDGQAELSGYELTYPRYGEERSGTAVTVVVTETFSHRARVKSEDPSRPEQDTYPVLKLNLVQDFPTGIYDYNLMTSAFVALADPDGRGAGRATKISFSAQEWCGQAYSQLRFDRDAVRLTSHSYFDGEADRTATLDAPAGGIAEDVLLLWARGLAAPLLDPGREVEVPLLRSLELARLGHVPVSWERVKLSRSAEARARTVPAGTFEVDELQAAVPARTERRDYPPSRPEVTLPGRTWTFWVERNPPRRLVAWSRDDGVRAELVGTTRAAYWQMQGREMERAVERLGLRPRPPRTP